MNPDGLKYSILNINRDAPPPKIPDSVRLLLFSDIHLGLFPKSPLQLLNKRIIGSFNHLLRRKKHIKADNIRKLADALPAIKPDLVLCAGDLTAVSLTEEFALAEQALAPVLDQLQDNFIYIPGNHDAYIRGKRESAALEACFRKLNNGRWSLSDLPLLFNFRGINLLLLNGALPMPPAISCGRIQDEERRKAENLLASLPPEAPCAVLCHFPVLHSSGDAPPHRHSLLGGDFLIEHLKTGKISCILSGHEHSPYATVLPGGGTQLCAGSLTINNSFAVIDFIPN